MEKTNRIDSFVAAVGEPKTGSGVIPEHSPTRGSIHLLTLPV